MLSKNIKTWWRIFLNWCLSYIIDRFIYIHESIPPWPRQIDFVYQILIPKELIANFKLGLSEQKHSLNSISKNWNIVSFFVKWYHYKKYYRCKNNFMCCLIQLLLLMFVTLLSCWHKTHLNQLSRKSILTECVAIYFIQTYMKTHVAIIGDMNQFWIIS